MVVVILLPLFVFVFSSFMEPDRCACAYGWLDCFIMGKLALTPRCCWPRRAFCALEMTSTTRGKTAHSRAGLYVGIFPRRNCCPQFVSCYGVGMCDRPPLRRADAPKFWLLVPFYVAMWYSVRALELIKASDFNFWPNFISLVGSLPFWLASWLWSRHLYDLLPDKAPDGCFVVTAAGRGHAKFVGPHFGIEHKGQRRLANQQLVTFWQFENLWRAQFPHSHVLFRKIYNRVGPVVARRISSPWLADLTFVALKPVELVARLTTVPPKKLGGFSEQKL